MATCLIKVSKNDGRVVPGPLIPRPLAGFGEGWAPAETGRERKETEGRKTKGEENEKEWRQEGQD